MLDTMNDHIYMHTVDLIKIKIRNMLLLRLGMKSFCTQFLLYLLDRDLWVLVFECKYIDLV